MILWSACDSRRTAGEHEQAVWAKRGYSFRSRSSVPSCPTTRSTGSISTRMSARIIAGDDAAPGHCHRSRGRLIRLGGEKKQIGQPLLGDEPFKISYLGIADV